MDAHAEPIANAVMLANAVQLLSPSQPADALTVENQNAPVSTANADHHAAALERLPKPHAVLENHAHVVMVEPAHAEPHAHATNQSAPAAPTERGYHSYEAYTYCLIFNIDSH